MDTITISDLLRHSRPLTGAASLQATTVSPPSLKRRKTAPEDDPPHSSPSTACPAAAHRPLTPLTRPTVLVGTVDLPSASSSDPCGSGKRCLCFSDGAGRVCCDVLEFDPGMVGRKITVLAWNYVPFKKGGGGVLEIVRWSFVEAIADVETSMPSTRGVLRSVSPVFAVPLNREKRESSSGGAAEVGDTPGFLFELAICQCGLCGNAISAKDRSLRGNLDYHSFTGSIFVYFPGHAFSFHQVLCKLVGSTVEISGLKKKKVFVGEDEMYIMLVSTERTVVCRSEYSMGALTTGNGRDAVTTSEAFGTYDGVVTGIYMNDMVVELDEKVWLLLTDPLLSLPHSLRVGALISVRNVHIIHSNFSWTKVLLLGACIKTTLLVKSFSPFNTECVVGIHTQYSLVKFIDSLAFSAKFWVLLLFSCLRKKFHGVFSDREILGTKNKEGFACVYATSHLPSCVSQPRKGVFMEFCKHEDCCCQNQPIYNPLELVPPLCNFIDNCQTTWISMLPQHEAASDAKHMHCEEYSYDRLARRFIPSKDLGVILIGSLWTSPSTKRLQLFDKTGSIDIVVPDLPPDINTNSIFEIKDYVLIMEGLPAKVELLQSSRNGSLSCRSILQNFQSRNELIDLTIYVHFYLRNSTCLNKYFRLPVARNMLFESNAVYHLLYLTHKFPALHDDNSVISNGLKAFAESVLLPYDLMVVDECGNEDGQVVESSTRMTAEVKYADWLRNPEKWSKKSQSIHSSHEIVWSGNSCFSVADGSFRIPCLLTLSSNIFRGFLVCSKSLCVGSSGSCRFAGKHSYNSLLLEFKADTFSKYQSLHVGAYYILKEPHIGVKHLEEYAKSSKIIVSTQKSLWQFSFSLGNSAVQHEPQCNRPVGDSPVKENDSVACNSHHMIFFNQHCNQSQRQSDIHLHVSSEHIKLLKSIDKLQVDGLFNSVPGWTEVVSVSSCIEIMKGTLSQPSGTVRHECNLPEGIIISLCGNIMDVHFFHRTSCALPNWLGNSTNMHREGLSNVCIHAYENEHMVKIKGKFGKHFYPLGMGPGANVTFHRLLMTCNSSRTYKLFLTPASFVMVNSIKEVGSLCDRSDCHPQSSSRALKEYKLNKRAFELIFRSIQPSEDNAIRIHCRVDHVIFVALEKQTPELGKGLRQKFNKPLIKAPFAGFVMDDGSSTFCCWADAHRAETLLRFHESLSQALFGRISKKRGVQNIWDNCDHSLDKILKKHHRVIIENYEALKDPTCVDFAFSINSTKPFSTLEEKFLKSILLFACRGPMLDIVGTVMDLNTLGCSKMPIDIEGLKQIDIWNFWVREVNPLNFLTRSRSLLDELLAKSASGKLCMKTWKSVVF